MQYNKGPAVINTVPGSNEVDFPVDGQIVVSFDKDISKVTIAGNVLLLDRHGERVECRYQYANKRITIVPRASLLFNTTYTVVLHGDNNPNSAEGNKGLTSPVGEPMLGDYSFCFTTYANSMKAESIIGLTPNGIALTEMPTLKGDTTSETINPTRTVEIQISSSNTFEAGVIIWSGEVSIERFREGFKPSESLFDGSYYWRARSWSNVVEEVYGEWSEIAQFAIETHADATAVATDSVDVDVAFPSGWNMLEPSITNVYPIDGRSGVKTNLKTISIEIDQIISEEALADCYISLTGVPIDDDNFSESHDEVDVSNTTVVYDYDAETTTIIITLPELEGEE